MSREDYEKVRIVGVGFDRLLVADKVLRNRAETNCRKWA
jgi:hypothetical protein